MSEKLRKGQKSGKSFGSCNSCLEAARKGDQQGLEGPEARRKRAGDFADVAEDRPFWDEPSMVGVY
jgi:hypothetical protein